jgi:cephalosporin hydroxylase
MHKRITMIEGSSIDPDVVGLVKQAATGRSRVVVCLDSSHTHEPGMYPDRPWGPGNNPMTAVREYLRTHPEFEVDRRPDDKLLISVAPGGYLRRLR